MVTHFFFVLEIYSHSLQLYVTLYFLCISACFCYAFLVVNFLLHIIQQAPCVNKKTAKINYKKKSCLTCFLWYHIRSWLQAKYGSQIMPGWVSIPCGSFDNKNTPQFCTRPLSQLLHQNAFSPKSIFYLLYQIVTIVSLLIVFCCYLKA